MIVVRRNQPVPMACDLRCGRCREVETETKEDFGALFKLGAVGHFIDAKLLAADRALSSSVSERIQLRSRRTMGTKQVTGEVTRYRTHQCFEVRQDGIRIDNHCGCGKRIM